MYRSLASNLLGPGLSSAGLNDLEVGIVVDVELLGSRFVDLA